MKSVQDLMQKYPKDFNSNFVNEIALLKHSISQFEAKIEKLKPLGILDLLYKNSLQSAFPNVEVALRIFLTLPVV